MNGILQLLLPFIVIGPLATHPWSPLTVPTADPAIGVAPMVTVEP